MSIQDKRIDFCEQKAIFENLGKVRRIPRMTTEEGLSNVIGLTMIMDKDARISCAWKAQYAVDSTKEKPVISVTSNFGNEHQKFSIVLFDINPKKATLLEMFALCSYADDNHLCKESVIASFKELKNYDQQKKYEQFIYEKNNWEEIIIKLKREYLDAGSYAQYQSCLQLLDIIDFIVEKGVENQMAGNQLLEENLESMDIEEQEDKTAEIVMDMIKKEWYKYCID